MESERTSIELYRRLESSITDIGTKATCQGLVEGEQTHMLLLEAQLDSVKRSGTFMRINELTSQLPV